MFGLLNSVALFSDYHFTFVSDVFFICGVFSLITALLTNRIRNKYDVTFLTLMSFAVSWWAFAVIFEVAGKGEFEKFLWSKISYPGIVTTPVFYFLFAMEYGQFWKRLSKRLVIFLLSFSFIILIFALTNEYHLLVWPQIEIDPVSNIAFYSHGPVFWIFVVFTYSLLISGLIIYFFSIFRFSYFYRNQTLIMISGSLLPIWGNIVYLFNLNPIPGLDWTPIGLSLSASLLALGVSGFKFIKSAPIPRSILIESISEGIIFLNNRNRVLDINTKACVILNKTIDNCLGEPIEELIPQWDKITELFSQNRDFHTEFVKEGDSPVFLDLKVSYLNKKRKEHGKLMLISDITTHKTTEVELKQLNERLNNQLEIKSELEDRLKKEVIRDPLTGAFNRRYLSEISPVQINKSINQNYSIGLMMIDIDHFKGFNDQYGHSAGDYVLKTLVSRLENKIRDKDFICRYGGEEFLVLLPHIEGETLYKRADQWRADIASEPITFDNEVLNITISVGIALFPQHGGAFDDVLKAADHAMYLAKAAGRNRTVLFNE